MPKSATEVMQDVIFAAVMDSIVALKEASKGLPNTLLRDINALHANTSFGDLPEEVQRAIGASVRTAFNRLMREGYSVAPADAGGGAAVRRPPREGAGPDRTRPPAGRGDRPGPPGGRGDRPGPRPPRPGDGRPRGKPPSR